MTLKRWGYKDNMTLPKPRHEKKRLLTFEETLLAQGWKRRAEGYQSPDDGQVYKLEQIRRRVNRAKEKAGNEK